jgi:hypothetical protein
MANYDYPVRYKTKGEIGQVVLFAMLRAKGFVSVLFGFCIHLYALSRPWS